MGQVDRSSLEGHLSMGQVDRSSLVGHLSMDRVDRSSLVGHLSMDQVDRFSLVGRLSMDRVDRFSLVGRLSMDQVDRFSLVGHGVEIQQLLLLRLQTLHRNEGIHYLSLLPNHHRFRKRTFQHPHLEIHHHQVSLPHRLSNGISSIQLSGQSLSRPLRFRWHVEMLV